MVMPIPLLLWLAGLATLIVALCRISMWVERWKIEREKEEEPYRQPNDQNSRQDTQGSDLSAISSRLYAIAHQLHTQKEQYRRADRDNALRSNITIVCIALTAFFAFGSDWIFYNQLNTMQEDRRAWIGPSDASITSPLAVGQGIKYTVKYINTGREPGVNFYIGVGVKIFSQTEWKSEETSKFIRDFVKGCFAVVPDLPCFFGPRLT